MKGIVVEIAQKDAVVLTEDGVFAKVKNQKYAVGQTVDTRMRISFGTKWVAGAASMAATLAISTIGAFAYYTPTDYVSMDVNPSIEYTVNMFDRILEARAVNEDGSQILADLDLKNKNLKVAMEETLDQLIRDGYLADDPDSGVVITTSNEEQSDAEQLAADLKKEVKTYLANRKGITARVDADAVKPEKVEEAKDLGVTPGKLTLVEKLQESTSGAISVDDWLNKPVKEINKAIKENRKTEKSRHGNEPDQDVSTGAWAQPDHGDNNYTGKWRQDVEDENEDGQHHVTEGAIIPNSMPGWNWNDKKTDKSGENRNWNNGQGNDNVKDWFDDRNHNGNGNGNGRDWGPNWTTSGSVELPGYGNPSNRHSGDDKQSDKADRSDDEDQSDDTE
jgi:hypothetical protein